MRLSGVTSAISLFVKGPTSVQSDAKGYLAIHSSSSESPPTQCEHNHVRYGSVAIRDLDNIYVSSGMLCYFLYWFIQFPFMFVSPQKIRPLFLAKAILVPPTWLALLIWAFVRVPPNNSLLAPKTALGSKELSWAWLSAFNSAIGFFATAGVNMPDFTVSNCTLYKHLYM